MARVLSTKQRTQSINGCSSDNIVSARVTCLSFFPHARPYKGPDCDVDALANHWDKDARSFVVVQALRVVEAPAREEPTRVRLALVRGNLIGLLLGTF